MKLIDGSILKYKEDGSGDTWIYFGKGFELPLFGGWGKSPGEMTYSEVEEKPGVFDLFWLPEGLL